MTANEVKKLLAWAVANFPQLQERDMRPTAELWARMLADVPYEVAEKALMKVLATAKYFPTVAEMREAVAELTSPQVPDAMDAWGEVVRAIRNYGYYRQEEALASLSPITRKVVENIGWQEICLSEEPDVIRGQFRMAYEVYAKRVKTEAVLPADVKDAIATIAGNMDMQKRLESPKKLILKLVSGGQKGEAYDDEKDR